MRSASMRALLVAAAFTWGCSGVEDLRWDLKESSVESDPGGRLHWELDPSFSGSQALVRLRITAGDPVLAAAARVTWKSTGIRVGTITPAPALAGPGWDVATMARPRSGGVDLGVTRMVTRTPGADRQAALALQGNARGAEVSGALWMTVELSADKPSEIVLSFVGPAALIRGDGTTIAAQWRQATVTAR